MERTSDTISASTENTPLDRLFRSALKAVVEELGDPITEAQYSGNRALRSPLALTVRLEGVGQIEALIGNLSASVARAKELRTQVNTAPVILPFDQSARVQKAKDLLAAGTTYPQGCSGFVCEVLGIPWEAANDLMGSSPVLVGDNNSYNGLVPGDIAGWTATSGSGHVTVYIGERGTKFIDVRSEGETPRAVGNGYGNGRPVYKSSRF
jgi:hypothetical protein